MRQDQFARCFRQRGIALHLAIGLDLGVPLDEQVGGSTHLARRLGVVAAEVGMRDKRDLRLEIETLDMHRGLSRDIGQFLGRGIRAYLRIGDKICTLAGDHQRERGEIARPRQIADDFPDVPEMPHVAALDAAEHRVGFATHHRQRGNDRRVGADRGSGDIRRCAVTAGDVDIGLNIRAVTRIVFRVDQIEILAGLDRKTEPFDTSLHNGRSPNQNGPRQFFLKHRPALRAARAHPRPRRR